MKSVLYHQRLVFIGIFVGYSLYVLCRKSFSFVIPYVQHEEKLSKEDLGAIVSSLNLAYAISKFVFGVLSDRIGATLLFSSGLITTAVTVIGFGRFHGVGVFAFLWFINGLGQGCGWPACSKLLRKWFKPDQFGTWWSVLSASMNVTGALVPVLLPLFTLSNGGWRTFMLVSGLLSMGWALFCLLIVHESPESIGLPPFTNDDDGTSSAEKEKKDASSSNASASLKDLLSSPFLWLLSLYYLIVFAAKTSFENWAQLLIVDDKGLSTLTAVTFVSCFETGGMAGSFTTGYITDLYMAKMLSQNSPESIRRSNPRMIVSIAYIIATVLGLQTLVTSDMMLPGVAFILGFALYGNINIFGIVATESAPIHLSGTSHSIVSLAANVGAVMAGYPFSVIAHSYGWLGVFALLEMCCFGCFVLMLALKGLSTEIGYAKIKSA